MVGTRSWSRVASTTLLAFSPANLLAQASWTQTQTSGGPGPLCVHAAAYDLNRLRLVLFGGFDANYSPQGATWEFDGRDWFPVTTANPPPPRAAHALAYDSVRGRIVLFGGTTSIFGITVPPDTWEFDGTSWTQAASLHQPTPRLDHAMAFDMVAGQVVLFGGRSSLTTRLGDTWLWNGIDWVQHMATGPAARNNHAMCYDLLRARTVLFGGSTGADQGDTWEWDGAAWGQVAATGPAARSSHGMVFDISRAVSVMHGGSWGGDETWEWNGATWTSQSPTSAPRADHAMVYDARLQRATLFGGLSTSPALVTADVQTYGDRMPGSYVVQGTSCAGTAGTPQLFEPNATATGPMIGQTSTLLVTPTPWHTFFVFGMSNLLDGSTPLPFDLAGYGMPGCALRVSRDVVTSRVPMLGVATMQVSVPNDPFLAGLPFFVQAFPIDLSANAMGFLTTNALAATVGRP